MDAKAFRRPDATFTFEHSFFATNARVLVISPGTVNYFYDVTARRIAEALAELSLAVRHTTLQAFLAESTTTRKDYAVAILVNVPEIAFSMQDAMAAQTAFAILRDQCQHLVAIGMDAVTTPWFRNVFEQSRAIGADLLVDLGLIDQSPLLPDSERKWYRFLLAGLTSQERSAAGAANPSDPGRTLPWVFVGHHTQQRAALAAELKQSLDPNGFVYLPPLEPFRATGPHLNEAQFHELLSRSRLQVWCAHHESFYMESERFRSALLAGCLPIKVTPMVPEGYSRFRRQLYAPANLGPVLTRLDVPNEFSQFRDEYLSLPPLATELARILGGLDKAPLSGPLRWLRSMRRIGRELWRGKTNKPAATPVSLGKGY